MIIKNNIVIVGYPKSGNTWLTRLVAELLKCPIVGFLDQPLNNEIAIEGSDRDSQYAVFKSHYTFHKLKQSPTRIFKIIYIVRDPRDVAISGAHYFNFDQFKSIKGARAINKVDAMVDTICHGSSYPWCQIPWYQHVSDYLSESSGILMVRYEDLLLDGLSQLIRIANFVGVKRSDKEIQDCIEAQSFERVKQKAFETGDLRNLIFLREGKQGQYRNFLSIDQVLKIDLSCLNEMLNLGYQTNKHFIYSSGEIQKVTKMDSKQSNKDRYLLCRPQGGLNDLLCQIEKCCRYAELTGRIVIVDTNYSNTTHFNDEFQKYFISTQKNLYLSIGGFQEKFENMSVFPAFLSQRLNSYTTDKKQPMKPLVDSLNNEVISFDFKKDYTEQLVVHHSDGGGNISLFALGRMKLAETLIAELEQRLFTIAGEYSAIHVRHTDYLSNYPKELKLLIDNPPTRLFVATDNQLVLNEFKASLKETSIYSFSKNLSVDGDPIHILRNMIDDEVNIRNKDAILDLLLLALSNDLRLVELSERKGFNYYPQFSGFSMLALNLRSSKTILKELLSVEWFA